MASPLNLASFRRQYHEAHLWKPSFQDEFDSHVQNGTWDLVPLLPGRIAIGT